jgi:hypothetical protein
MMKITFNVYVSAAIGQRGQKEMGKNPAFQFYPSDWTRDLDDQDIEVEGAWIRICCRLWWSETKGKATKPLWEWARILRKTKKKTRDILEILIRKGISSGDVLDNQNITIISRRMVRDFEISQIRKDVGKLGGNPNLMKHKTTLDNQTDNQKPTPSSSSSSSTTNHKEEEEDSPPFFPEEKEPQKKKTIPPSIDDVKAYCRERKNNIDPEGWMAFYNSNGWMVGKNKMRDWKAAIITWEKRGGNGDGRGKPDGQGRPGVQYKEYTGSDVPKLSEAERKRNLERIREITGG